MKELNESALRERMAREGGFALFWYTPLCGTCRIGARMLEVAEAALPGLELYSINVNTAPGLAQAWKVASVPCLMHVRGGAPAERTYRMESAGTLFHFLQGK